MFDTKGAENRLEAAYAARAYLDAAVAQLVDANVVNQKVKKALVNAQSEVTRFINTTKFAINKRRERNKEHRGVHYADNQPIGP